MKLSLNLHFTIFILQLPMAYDSIVIFFGMLRFSSILGTVMVSTPSLNTAFIFVVLTGQGISITLKSLPKLRSIQTKFIFFSSKHSYLNPRMVRVLRTREIITFFFFFSPRRYPTLFLFFFFFFITTHI